MECGFALIYAAFFFVNRLEDELQYLEELDANLIPILKSADILAAMVYCFQSRRNGHTEADFVLGRLLDAFPVGCWKRSLPETKSDRWDHFVNLLMCQYEGVGGKLEVSL